MSILIIDDEYTHIVSACALSCVFRRRAKKRMQREDETNGASAWHSRSRGRGAGAYPIHSSGFGILCGDEIME